MKKILISLLFIVIACGEAEESPNELKEGSNFIPFDGTVFVSNNILNSSDNSSFTSLKKIPKESWKWILITAYTGTFFPVYLISYGQTEIESGLASIITTITPINTLLVGIIFFGTIPILFNREFNS